MFTQQYFASNAVEPHNWVLVFRNIPSRRYMAVGGQATPIKVFGLKVYVQCINGSFDATVKNSKQILPE